MSINAGRDGQHPVRHRLERQRFDSVCDDVVLDRPHGRVFPGLGQAIVDECLQLRLVVLSVDPLAHQLQPARAAADLVVQPVGSVATNIGTRVLGHPAAGVDHRVFLVLFDHDAALAADVPARAGVRRPVQAAPFERLAMTAVGAWHVPLALVALGVQRVDAADAADLRRADLQPLVRSRERAVAAIEHLVGVVAAAAGGGEAGELVDDGCAHRGRLQARRIARVLQVKLAALELLERPAVRRVAAGRAGQASTHGGRFLDQRIELLVDPLV